MGSLGTVLDKLSSFFSQYFLVASYFPVLIFLGANAACAYAVSPAFRVWFGQDAVQAGAAGLEVLLAAAVLAYATSTASVGLRETLEALPLVPNRSREASIDRHTQRRAVLLARLAEHGKLRRDLAGLAKTWHQTLVDARKTSRTITTPCKYAEMPTLDSVVESIDLRRPRPIADITAAVAELVAQLTVNNVDERDAPTGARSTDAEKLDEAEVRLRRALAAAPSLHEAEAVRAYNEIQLNYARSGAVAPTRMGNIALSVQDYFSSRYHLNFNFFFTRIQKELEGEEKFVGVLKLAKAQLEFHVAMVWLGVAFCVIWIPLAAWWGFSLPLFLACGIGGPAMIWISYELAVHSYYSYADLLRTTVDLYHFKLMDALHLRLPASSNDERELWKEVGQWLDQGDYLEVAYKHPAAS